MLEGDAPLANFEPYEAAKYVRETGLHFAQKDMSLNWESKFVENILSTTKLLLLSCMHGPTMNHGFFFPNKWI